MARRRAVLFVAGTLAVWLIVLALVGKVSIDRISAPPWGNSLGDDTSATVTANSHVGQVFTAPFTGLYRIEVYAAAIPTDDVSQVSLHLTSGPGADSDLHVATFDSADLQGGNPISIEFEPQRDSKGREYYFYVESASPAEDGGITLRYGPQSILDGASATLDEQPIGGNLEFLTFYSLRTRDKVDLLLTRLAEGRPYFLGTKTFYIVLAAAYCIVLAVFLLFVARRILDESRGEA